MSALPSVHWRRRASGDPLPNPPPALAIFYRAAPPADFPANATALLIDPPGGGFWGEPGEMIEHPLVSDYEKDSVPLRFVGLDSVSLQSAREFRPAAGAEVFAQSFGKPLVFGRWPRGDLGRLRRPPLAGAAVRPGEHGLRVAHGVSGSARQSRAIVCASTNLPPRTRLRVKSRAA